MGRKARASASVVEQPRLPKPASIDFCPAWQKPLWVLVALAVVASAIVELLKRNGSSAASQRPQGKAEPEPVTETAEPEPVCEVGRFEDLVQTGKKHFREGRLREGIDDLVLAQKCNVNSEVPAVLLDSLRERFSGPDSPRHARSAVKAGMERLELVLYEEMYEKGDLQDQDGLFKLVTLELLYHSLDNPQEALRSLRVANGVMSAMVKAMQPGEQSPEEAQVVACAYTSKFLIDVVKERDRLSKQVLSGKKPSEIASQILPSPPFQLVDKRARLSLQEYREKYMSTGRPVIITDYAERTLGGSWGWDEMDKACGEMQIIVSQRSTEARHLWAGLGHSGANQTLGSFMQEVRKGTASSDGYLMDWGLVGRCQLFLDKFVVPKYFASDLWKALPFNQSGAKEFFARHPSVFVGAAGSGGALHVDSYASTFWQLLLKGRKRWTLYALPEKLRRTLLYAGVEHEIMPLTPAAGESFNASKLPLLSVAEEFKVVVEVSAGEIMVVPHDVPHMVENLEDVLAISMNILDEVAVPRIIEDLHHRRCFSTNQALSANLQILETYQNQRLQQKPSAASTADVDLPFAAFARWAAPLAE